MISGSTDLGRFSFRVKVLQRRSQRMSSTTYVHTTHLSREKTAHQRRLRTSLARSES
jgi:hypothetical protein